MNSFARWCGAGPSGYLPHGHCYFWEPDILWLSVASNLATALSYFTIPIILAWLWAHLRKKVSPRWAPVFSSFAAFILCCGLGHLLEVVVIWWPIYRVQAIWSLVTGTVSVVTATILWPVAKKLRRSA